MTASLMPGELPNDLQDKILAWCRDIIKAVLDKKTVPPDPGLGDLTGGVFVTLEKKGSLRGCIGSFDFDSLLSKSIMEMTRAAAFRDPRFPPLSIGELDDLDITVSVLTPPKPLNDLKDIVIGRDGLYLVHPRSRGVLLPVVAAERGWTPLEFARQTSQKAGLAPEAYQDPGAELLVFTAPAFSSHK